MVKVSVKVDPINRDIDLLLSQDLSGRAQSQAFAEYAHGEIEDAKRTNQRILGRVPRHTVTVDGREGAPLATVRPDGVIVAEFELVGDLLIWIEQQLVIHSPRKSGRYARSHVLFADGVEADVNKPPVAAEYVFVNVQPYARKIERGSSSQAPDGVYQAVAVMARRRFGNVARVSFSYRTLSRAKDRNPAVVVSLGGR